MIAIRIFKRFVSASVFASLLFLTAFYSYGQDRIKGSMSYGFVDDESGLLFARTDDAFYTIGASNGSFIEIPTGEMERDSISSFPGTPFVKILTPGLIIVDKLKNEIVFSQYDHQFSELYHVSLLPELDAFFLVAAEGAIRAPEALEEKKGLMKGLKKGLKGLANDATDLGNKLKRFVKSDSISFNLVDIQSGEILWKYLPDADQAGSFFTAPSDEPRLITENKVIFPFGDNFYCLDSQLGTLLWKHPYKRPGAGASIKSFFSSQQPSSYYVNVDGETGLLLFENYKKRKQDRVKELSMISHDGEILWKDPLDKEEYIQEFWKGNVLISTDKSVKVMDLKTGKNLWKNLYTTDKERLNVNIGPDFFLVEEKEKSAKKYPLNIFAVNPETGEKTWESPRRFASQRNRVRYRRNGILTYNKEEKDMAFLDYKSGETIWQYPKNSLYSYFAIGSDYYMLTKDGVEMLDKNGEKVWGDVIPMKKQRNLWNVYEDGQNKVIITNEKEGNVVKQVTSVSSNGEVLYQRAKWKVGAVNSLLFTKIIGDEFFYLTKDGFYKMNLRSTDKTEQLAKFAKDKSGVIFNYDKTLMAIKSDNNYYYLDLESGEFALLTEGLKFKGKNESRVFSFIGRKGLLIQNQENAAYVTLDGDLIYNKYYKYPETSQLGLKILRAAVSVAVTAYQISEAGKYYEDAGGYYASGDMVFANKALKHAGNMQLAGLAGGLTASRISEFTYARDARQRLAERAKPLTIFAVKRKYGEKKEVLLIHMNPETGEELSEILLGEKNPVFYVDEVGRMVYFIDKKQFINRLKI